MSWRSGSALFLEMWPLIQARIPDQEVRIEFTSKLLELFVDGDMDPFDVEDVHTEVRAAMRTAGISLSEPERYESDFASNSGDARPGKRQWWRLW